MKTRLLSAALLVAATPLLAGEDFSIPWHTIDAGGDIHSSGGDWELSGTIGQWDATDGDEISGGTWRLTGGFWGLDLEELANRLFSDRFEGGE